MSLGFPPTEHAPVGAGRSPLPRSPVQVIGPVPCNDSHRNIEDLVVWELNEKQLLTLALFPLQPGIPPKGRVLEG